MQVLSKFIECDTAFVAYQVKDSQHALIRGPLTVSKVEIETKRTAASIAWEITYIYTMQEVKDARYYEANTFRTIEEALCAVDDVVHPKKPQPGKEAA